MIIIDTIEQGSEEWIKEKLGIPSASNASQIISGDGKKSTQRKGYLYTLAAESITKMRADSYKSAAMEVGNEREEESRTLFEMVKDVEVEQVGMIYKDEKKEFLCSPDGIIKRIEGLELKNVLPKTQVKYLLSGKLPPEYFVQVQSSLYVTGFKVWHFCSYSPSLRPLIIKVERDEDFIKKLEAELKSFTEELKQIINKIR